VTPPPAGGPASGHGAKVPPGMGGTGDSPIGGRFGKMFTDLHYQELDPDCMTALEKVIKASGTSHNHDLPAGFTYLAQFVDHDLTFDPTPQGARATDPNAVTNFRTPRLDLDSLYGSGPADQPYLYESRDETFAGVKLLTGRSDRGLFGLTKPDLPRNEQDRALIGDPRNDENLIVSQLHLLFIRFHNKVVDRLSGERDLKGGDLFREARRIVSWHYQEIVVHDLLRRLVGQEMLDSVLERREHFNIDTDPFIPVEFAGAAYRFGHSLVRSSYAIRNRKSAKLFAPTDRFGLDKHLGGFRRLPHKLTIDWRFFFELSDKRPQPSNLIDANIVEPLWNLPASNGVRHALPLLNLGRAKRLDVPSGQAVAEAMQVKQLDATELGFIGAAAPSRAIRAKLMAATPLWYYVLREAAIGGGKRLGPIGGRIVAEVLIELLRCDSESYLAHGGVLEPRLPSQGDKFTMADLIRFTEA